MKETTRTSLPDSRVTQRWRTLRSWAADDGFSLLEVMVSLAILALAVAIVLPSLSASLASASRQAVRADLARQIVEYRLRAHDLSVALVLADPSPFVRGEASDKAQALQVHLSLPAGWRYRVRHPIIFSQDSDCSGGDVILEHDGGEQMTIALEPGQCLPRAA